MTAQTRHTITNSVGLLGITALLVAIILQLGAAPAPQIDPAIGRAGGINFARDGASINKFGATLNADTDVITDVWDRANPSDNQPIWVAPTAPRIHALVSTDAADTSGGAGARTLELYGLPDWDTPEIRETVTLNGTSPVNTASTFVIIHRIVVLTSGASGPNVGRITATAATDGTVTAQIEPTFGQTQMAIWGVPRGQSAYFTHYYGGLLRQSGANNGLANLTVVASMDIENQPTVWILKHSGGASINGETHLDFGFYPFVRLRGPFVIKVQVSTSLNNAQAFAGFDAILLYD